MARPRARRRHSPLSREKKVEKTLKFRQARGDIHVVAYRNCLSNVKETMPCRTTQNRVVRTNLL